jgi:hypothetical protein
MVLHILNAGGAELPDVDEALFPWSDLDKAAEGGNPLYRAIPASGGNSFAYFSKTSIR